MELKEKIEHLISLGMTKDEAERFVRNIAELAWIDAYYEGENSTPAIIGESIGDSGMDFDDWFTINTK